MVRLSGRLYLPLCLVLPSFPLQLTYLHTGAAYYTCFPSDDMAMQKYYWSTVIWFTWSPRNRVCNSFTCMLQYLTSRSVWLFVDFRMTVHKKSMTLDTAKYPSGLPVCNFHMFVYLCVAVNIKLMKIITCVVVIGRKRCVTWSLPSHSLVWHMELLCWYLTSPLSLVCTVLGKSLAHLPLIPHFFIVGFTGAVAAVCTNFVFPAAIYLRLMSISRACYPDNALIQYRLYRRAPAIALLIIGMFIGVFSTAILTYQTIRDYGHK